MIKVFIPTVAPDLHALAVKWALNKKGHDAILWYGSNFPTKASMSYSVSLAHGSKWDLSDPELSLDDIENAIDVVWLRRPSFAQLPEKMHVGDKIIAEREWKCFVESLLWGVAPEAFWINPMSSLYRAESKPVQLREAIKVGLSVGNTLFSNDPDKIKKFLANQPETIFKSFTQGLWLNGDKVASSLTTPITSEQLPKDQILRLVPGIFQEKIAKKYELRVTFFGEYAIAVKIVQNDFSHSAMDSRINLNEQTVTPCSFPKNVFDKCIALMKRLNICFGCFDFIVTPDDEYIFLEVNQMGQFLWIEDLCPEIPMLDIFTNFLISQTPTFKNNDTYGEKVHFSDFNENELEKVFETTKSLHVPYNKHWQVAD